MNYPQISFAFNRMDIRMPDGQITFSDVDFSWEKHKKLFTGLNCVIPLDKIILLTGENGCGKSTFASLAAGLIKPLRGKIALNRIGYASRDANCIYQYLSFLQQKAEKNILGIDAESDLKLWGMSVPKLTDVETAIKTGLIKWGLSEILHRPVWELSAGEKKRLNLAGLDIFSDRFWIMDEPENALDTEYCGVLLTTLLNRFTSGTGALIITHNSKLYQDLFDEHWHIMSDGTLEVIRDLV